MYKNIYFRLFAIIFIIPLIVRCQDQEEKSSDTTATQTFTGFGPAQDLGAIVDQRLNEASGIAVSSQYENAIWVHNDSGNEPILFLIDHQGNTLKTFFLKDIENRDWEDITIGPGPEEGQCYLYIGEIGDNNQVHNTKYIYRIPEPQQALDRESVAIDTIDNYDIITLSYPEKTQNAESLMIDPFTKDLYIIAKNLDAPLIYRLPSELIADHQSIILEKENRINIQSEGPPDLVTAADISTDGLEVLVKTYGYIYYWKRESSQTSISQLLQTEPLTIEYTPEPQGEAISFTTKGDGFYTLSENRFGIIPHLFFYPRK